MDASQQQTIIQPTYRLGPGEGERCATRAVRSLRAACAQGGVSPPARECPRPPAGARRFPAPAVRRMVEEELVAALRGKVWGAEAAVWATALAGRLKDRSKELLQQQAAAAAGAPAGAEGGLPGALPRYKLVTFVALGENRLQGVRVTSRCLWDADTDNYATCSWKNVREEEGGKRALDSLSAHACPPACTPAAGHAVLHCYGLRRIRELR